MISTLTAKPDALWCDRATARDAALRKRVPDLPDHQVAPWTPEPLLVIDRGAPWIVMPYDKDPLRTPDGGYPFPRDVKHRLEGLAASGAEFDRMWVDMMITHHEGAVAMGKTEVADGANEQATQLAQTVVDAQTTEIAELKSLATELA